VATLKHDEKNSSKHEKTPLYMMGAHHLSFHLDK